MYSFTDRGGDSVTLRPEATAGICRALVSNGLTQDLPQKVFYAGPMFRYERPQKGRYRQFHQIDAEFLGTSEPIADAEMIALGAHVLDALGIAENCTLEVNTLGDLESRTAYRAALVAHFSAHAEKLSADSRLRLEKNPLRILDSKDAGDRALVADAPTIDPFLTDAARAHWDGLRDGLRKFGIAFVENPRIVRGLDYYGHTAFEFVTNELGAQGTVMGGGRYDGLVQEMGGPPTPCIGWAAGVERLAMLLPSVGGVAASVAVIPIGPTAEAEAPKILQALRRQGVRAEMEWRGNLKRRMERANKRGARAAVIFGESELAAGQAQVKDLATGAQDAVPLDRLAERLG
jgi:histidyl-tRNA synthetase